MTVWWRYQDIVNAVGIDRAAALERDLLRGLANGAICASADLVIYSTKAQMVREEVVTLAPAMFRERRSLMTGSKQLNFRPSIGKLFNPRSAGPEGYPNSPFEEWAVDCFGLAYRGVDLIKELDLPVVEAQKQNAAPPPLKRGGGRRPSKADWVNFSAALAVVAAIDDNGIDTMASAASIYDRVALVLQERLGKNAEYFELDNVQDAITLAQDWIRKGQIGTR